MEATRPCRCQVHSRAPWPAALLCWSRGYSHARGRYRPRCALRRRSLAHLRFAWSVGKTCFQTRARSPCKAAQTTRRRANRRYLPLHAPLTLEIPSHVR